MTKLDNVEVLDHHRPHYALSWDGTTHRLPASFVDDVISGTRCWTDADNWEDMLRSVLSDYRAFKIEEAKHD